MNRPNSKTIGLRHVALFVENLEACQTFYQELLGMKLDWQPDANNVYLSSGFDNLALHRGKSPEGNQRLDHIGFLFASPEEIDEWFAFLSNHAVTMIQAPKTHRDDSRSFYCKDPAGTVVQFIYIPNVKS